jgi:hypothetical protein
VRIKLMLEAEFGSYVDTVRFPYSTMCATLPCHETERVR